MNKESIKENLISLRNVQTHAWTAMLVTISGTLSLLWTFKFLFTKILFILGIMFFIFFMNLYLNKNENIRDLTQKLEEK